MRNSYQYKKQSYNSLPAALSVQDGNYEYTNTKTNQPVKASDIYYFAKNYLQLTYIFWGNRAAIF